MASGEPRIVSVGGGHGLHAALRAARMLTTNVTAVVTVADDGGSSGILREQLGIPAPGDLRMAIAALAADEQREGLIQNRFKEGQLAGHPLGNLLIAALADLRGDFAAAVTEVAGLAGVVGEVMPSTNEPVRLRARIDGEEVAGQVSIARGPAAVERLWLDRNADAYHGALDAIAAADLVVLGPGALFTSVIAAMLPRGMNEAVAAAHRVAFVMNLAEQSGETLGMDAGAHLRAFAEHCPGVRLDAVLVHDGWTEQIPRPMACDFDALPATVVRADLRALPAEPVAHDPDKLATVLKGLLG